MIEASRRSVITGLLALIAAPAIVRAASLMKIAPTEIIRSPNYLTLQQITREAVRQFEVSNEFIKEIDEQYHERYDKDYVFLQGDADNNWKWPNEFARDSARVGTQFRIRFPDEYQYCKDLRTLVPRVPDSVALALTAPVVVVKLLEKPVTRRFWSK
jgi:hypothetical protein